MAALVDSFEQALVALDAASLSALARDHTASQWSLALRMGEKISLGRYEEAVEAHEELATRLRSLATHSHPFEAVAEHVAAFIATAESDDDRLLRQLVTMLLGVAHLNIFVQLNWTGPKITPSVAFESVPESEAIEALGIDGELCYRFVKSPHFLLVARTLLLLPALHRDDNALVSRHLWVSRYAFAHQRIISGPAESLRSLIDSHFPVLLARFSNDSSAKLAAALELEYALVFHYYRNSVESRERVLKAQKLTKLSVELSGALGKRTRFQSFDLPQLVLLAKSDANEERELITESSIVPETIINPDPEAPALPHIAFADAVAESEANLTVLDQCIILALCVDVKNRNPKHGLTTEEMMVYVQRVLKNPNNWMVHSTALLLQSRLEFEKSHTIDKAVLQLEVLVNHDLEKDYDVAVRMKYLHLLAYPPQHELKRELGKKWLAIGSAASALELLRPLEMWEEVIQCFLVQERVEAAQELLRERLAIEPSPKFYCLLGDLTKDSKMYEKAWDMSGKRFSLAKRRLGAMAMFAQRFEEAALHLQEALAVNPQYAGSWFQLGVISIALEDFALAQKSFSRVVQLIPDDGEAWNNLASVFIKQNKKKEAYRALKEALKHKGESWKIWENFLLIAMDLGELHEVLLAMTKLLELKGNHIDVEILGMLVKLVTDDIKAGKSAVGTLLQKSLDDFLTLATTKIAHNAALWDLYARYWGALGSADKALAFRQKQCRALQVAGWEHTAAHFGPLVDGCEMLVADQLVYKKPKALASAKMFINSVLKKSMNTFGGTPEVARLEEMLQQLEAAVKNSA